jgi:hypothetical protein
MFPGSDRTAIPIQFAIASFCVGVFLSQRQLGCDTAARIITGLGFVFGVTAMVIFVISLTRNR